MTEENTLKQHRFAKGNQYARKHGFYSKVLSEKERQDYEQAVIAEGLDEEIALLRVKIKTLVETDPENVRLIMHVNGAGKCYIYGGGNV